MDGNAINGDALASGSLNASPEKLEVTTFEATAASTEASEIELLIKPAAATSKFATSTRGIIKTDVKEASEINDTVLTHGTVATTVGFTTGASIKILASGVAEINVKNSNATALESNSYTLKW